MINVEEYLIEKNIEYTLYEHPAVFTCEEAEQSCSHVPGASSKNLFLRDDKKKRYFLVILNAEKRADLKTLGEIFGVKRLTFASDQDLKSKLGLEPGSVSIFGLLNDIDLEVELFIDQEFYEQSLLNFHPNRNTASLTLSKKMLLKFLESIDHEVGIVEIA